MTDQDPIERMAQRVAQCRRLAASITDKRAAAILKQMAEEGEQDMKKLIAQRQSQELESKN